MCIAWFVPFSSETFINDPNQDLNQEKVLFSSSEQTEKTNSTNPIVV